MSDRGRMSLKEYIPEFQVTPEDYTPYIGEKRVEELKRLADTVSGKSWANVNSTLFGGGVAEILRGAIPLARSLGVDANWHVIKGDNEFYSVTKKFHNMLQGVEQPITLEEIFHAYLSTIDENTLNTFIASNLVVIHDPQPAALVMNGVIFGNVLWRCHIDTSSPNDIVWRFLLPYINQCSGAIFTLPEFVGPGIQVPLYQVTPCIDPLSEKNKQYTEKEALDILGPLFDEHDIDPERPIFAAISRYDIHKNQAIILKAFKRLIKENDFNPPPYLIFLGNTADDDPEGEVMLKKLQDISEDDPNVRIWVMNNNKVVGALMRMAKAFVHVSTREGFGLVVAEAMWQSTPVIGSSVGGIKLQVFDGETGYLVDPHDETLITENMKRVLENPQEAVEMGNNAKELVKNNFLLPGLVKRYLELLHYHTHNKVEVPEFRINDLTYREIISVIQPTPPQLSGDKGE